MKKPDKSTRIRFKYIPEPYLQFGFGQKMHYPRDGLFLYGPVSAENEIPNIRYGVIGTQQGIQYFESWSRKISGFIDIPEPGVRSKSVEAQHVPFPGFEQAFSAKWSIKPAHIISDIDGKELRRVLNIEHRHEAIKSAVNMYVERLVKEHNRLENPPGLWFVVIPEEVHTLGRPQSKVAASEKIRGEVLLSEARARRILSEPTLFGEDEKEAEVYKYADHFRRQLKARLLDDRIITQIARETTLAPHEFISDSGWPIRRLEDPATVAWKLCTSVYYKAGGRPWQLADTRPGVCYVGLVYKKFNDLNNDRHACCAAQMFLSTGEGVVFRGALGPWYSPDNKQCHLDQESAKQLIKMVVKEYEHLHERPPKELFIHARSAFNKEEWAGFKEACPASVNLVGVQIYDAKDNLKLFRPGNYPVIRGTAALLSERSAYLWTSGYVPRLDTYIGPETPNPIQVKIQEGECKLETVLSDVLGLTKINFNSCLYNDRLPVTIRFADSVGEVLISAPVKGEPKLPFKHYI